MQCETTEILYHTPKADPGTRFLHTDIFTTVKGSFNAGLCKQRDVSALEKLEADLIYPIFSICPAEHLPRVLAKAVSPAWQVCDHICQNTQ